MIFLNENLCDLCGLRGCFPTLMRSSISHRTLLQPRSLADALTMLRDEGPLTPLAGCTDLYVALNFGTLEDTRFLNLWRLDALRRIERRGRLLAIGARATHADLIRSPHGRKAPTVVRAVRTEAAIARGASVAEAQRVLMDEIAPIDDIRSTAEYRRRVAANLIARMLADRP